MTQVVGRALRGQQESGQLQQRPEFFGLVGLQQEGGETEVGASLCTAVKVRECDELGPTWALAQAIHRVTAVRIQQPQIEDDGLRVECVR